MDLQIYENNSIIAVGVFVVLSIIFYIFHRFALSYLLNFSKKTNTDIDDLILAIFYKIKFSFYLFLALFVSAQLISMPDFLSKLLTMILIILTTYQVVLCLQVVIDYFIGKITDKEDEGVQKNNLAGLAKIAKIVLWVFGVFLILSNVGVNITSLLAGLGIGGIAIALALQNILGDLFSSFAIYFDRPFVVGDFIIVGDKMGVVEKIGIKTTRIRALQGEEIVISNKELTSAQIQNFKKMRDRRIVFSFGVAYETTQEKLKKIPDLIKNIIIDVEHARFDRAHFYRFDDSSLYFEVVYYVKSGDYNIYMDVQQEINLGIRDVFIKEKISMPYPTRTVYLNKN